MTDYTVVGLDTSTRTGVAVVGEGNQVLHSEEVHFKEVHPMQRAGLIAGQVMNVVCKYTPKLVVIENYGFANSHTLVPLVEIGSIIRYFLHQEGWPYLLVAPPSLKKFVTGAGNAHKDQMMLAVYKKWSFEAKTNNIADAVGLAMLGRACFVDEFPLTSLAVARDIYRNQFKA